MAKKLPFGPVMIDIAGSALTASEKTKIAHPNTGGVILFTRNFQDPEQLSALTASIRAARPGPILIAVDQEGGRVQRFRKGFTRLPAASRYAHSPHRVKTAGWLMAAELLAVGIDFSFAPVLDVDCGVSEIIGDRSFSREPWQASRLSSLFRQGMNAAGMSAVGKHFPGHGAVALDSHLTLPVDERDWQSIAAKDLLPFKYLIAEGLEGIMPAHVVYPKIDSQPAGFSAVLIQKILRKELGFNGVVFSDDLSMEGAAIAGDFPTRAKLAQQAGCDMILVCNNPEAADQVLAALPLQEAPKRTQRLRRMQGKQTLRRTLLMNSEKWQQAASLISQLNVTENTSS